MRFDVDEAWNQLVGKGEVATLREYPYKAGQRVLARHKPDYEMKAVVYSVIFEPSLRTLRRKAKISGFQTWQEWVEKAKSLNKGSMPSYLCTVRVRE